jgi:DNA topoisomerase-3
MIILTEKPSVAAAFAKALGVPRMGAFWENDGYCIVNAVGHLLADFMPEEYDARYKTWNGDDLPIIPSVFKYRPIEKTKDQLAVVTSRLKAHKNDTLLLATDAEREGEVIGAEILEYAGFTNTAGAKRFWVSEALTPEVIQKGIAGAKPLSQYAAYRDQGYARAHADWLVGMNMSRLLSLKSGKTLTFGRVQTAILAAIYERDKAIGSFTREKYVEVIAALTAAHPFQVKLVNPRGGEFPHRFTGNDPLLAEIIGKKPSLSEGKVTGLSKERKAVYPPALFNLTALQKEAHRKFSYSPEQTLSLAQALYETHKCLSYPRTPSRVMGDDNVELVTSVYEALKTGYPDLSAGTDPALLAKTNKRLFNSAELQDHHALIPLKALPDDAGEPEKNIFTLVVKQFFTALKTPYVYHSIQLTVEIAEYTFTGSGIEILESGWKTSGDDEEEPPQDYSGIEQFSVYPVASVDPCEKFTEPKKHYTYASVLSLMENPRGGDGKHLSGLGTPATRGAILQNLIVRNYIAQTGKTIQVTPDGSFLVEQVLQNALLKAFVSVPETTRWEQSLHESTAVFLDGITEFVRLAVKNTVVDRAPAEKKSPGACPVCGSPVYEGKKNFYCSAYANEPKCPFVIWKDIAGASVSGADAALLLQGKQTKPKNCISKAGKPFAASFSLVNGAVKFIFATQKK